jgi:hypothetical protein
VKEEKDKLRDFMQGVFQDYEVQPDPEDWNRIEKTLSKKKKRRIIPWIIWASAASLLVLMAIYTGDIFNHTEKGSLQIAVNQTTSHKTTTTPDQKTKIAAAATTQANVVEKQQTTTQSVDKNDHKKVVTLAAVSIQEHNTVMASNKIASKPISINTIPSTESIKSFRNTDLLVHSIIPKTATLLKYQHISDLKQPPFNNHLTKDFLASNSSDIHFKGLSLSNSSGLIVQNSSGQKLMSYNGSFASQLASNMYLGSIKTFDNTYLTSTNIGSLFQNKSRNYLPPVTFGLNINLSLQPNWSIETGIQYTQLQSTGAVSINSSGNLQFSTSFSYNVDERLYYLGVPITLNYSFAQKRKTSYYFSTGLSIEKGLIAKYVANPEDNFSGMQPIYSHNAIKGMQFSFTTGVGISYKFIKHFELFGQPSVSYYFNSLGNKTTIFSVHPLIFNLRSGIRYTIK